MKKIQTLARVFFLPCLRFMIFFWRLSEIPRRWRRGGAKRRGSGILFVRVFFTLVFFFVASHHPGFAENLERVQLQLKQIRVQDVDLSEHIKENEKLVQQTRRELVKSANLISKLENEKGRTEDKISTLEDQKSKLLKLISQNSQNLSDVAGMLVAASLLNTSFDEKNTENYVLTGAIIKNVSKQFDSEMRTAAEQIKKLNKLQIKLEKEIGIFEVTKKKYMREQKELDKLLSARKNQNRELRGQQAALKKKLSKLTAKANNLSDLANKVVAPSRTSSPAQRIRMKFPASGMILLRFGQYDSAGLKSDGWRVRTRPNALVVAPADGRVVFADYFRKNYVAIIEHNRGYLTVLTGMGTLGVLINQNVLAGEPIGRMPPSNSEIYVELRHGNSAINPAGVFSEPM